MLWSRPFPSKLVACFPLYSQSTFILVVDDSKGRSVTPRWPRLTVCLQRSAGGRLLSFRIWSTHLLPGRPGRRCHWLLGGRPRDRLTWQLSALWAGTSSGSLATWLKRALRQRLMVSEMDGRQWSWRSRHCGHTGAIWFAAAVFGTSCGKPRGLWRQQRGGSRFQLHITIWTQPECHPYCVHIWVI